MDGEKPVCFYKTSIRDFIYDKDGEVKYHWISLNRDTCVNRVKNVNGAGMISFKLNLMSSETGQVNFKEHKAWKKNPPKRAHSVIIRAYIYQCKDIPAADSNGTSDPYIKVWDMSSGKPKQT